MFHAPMDDAESTDESTDDMTAAAPYAVNVQVKVELRVNGKPEPTDIARVMNILRKANFQGYVVLEYEAKENPYTTIPPLLKRIQPLLRS